MARRFPPPWTVFRGEGAYWVADAEGHRFAFVYYRSPDQTAGMGHNTDWLTEDEARRLATNFARLPELLKGR